MKLRIKGNSVRIRLSKTEVQELSLGSALHDTTLFGNSRFGYAVEPVAEGDSLYASYENDTITLYVPEKLLKDWPENTVSGFESSMRVNSVENLMLLLEKDFKCIDQTSEDQSDFFDNPAKTCE